MAAARRQVTLRGVSLAGAPRLPRRGQRMGRASGYLSPSHPFTVQKGKLRPGTPGVGHTSPPPPRGPPDLPAKPVPDPGVPLRPPPRAGRPHTRRVRGGAPGARRALGQLLVSGPCPCFQPPRWKAPPPAGSFPQEGPWGRPHPGPRPPELPPRSPVRPRGRASQTRWGTSRTSWSAPAAPAAEGRAGQGQARGRGLGIGWHFSAVS